MERKITYQLKIVQESNWLPHNEGSPHSSDMCPGEANQPSVGLCDPFQKWLFTFGRVFASLQFCSLVVSCDNLFTIGFYC